MASCIVLYTAPEDVEGFLEHYRQTHVPLVHELADLETLQVNRILGTPRGGEAPFFLQAELRFPNMEQMNASLRSEAGMAVSRDAMALCTQFGTRAEIMLADGV